MMGLTTPVDHADAYTWAAVALAHLAIGLGLTGALAAALSRLEPRVPRTGLHALGLVTALYLLGWEWAVQRLGAGIADALLDTAMIAAGGALGLLAWRRDGRRLALVIAAAALALAVGLATRLRR